MAGLDSIGSAKVTACLERPAAPPPQPPLGGLRALLGGGLILADVAFAWACGLYEYLRLENLSRLHRWVGHFGPWAPILYTAAYGALELVLVPALVLTVLAGIAFGPVWGIVYAWIGATASAAAAFLITRHGGREIVARWVARSRRLSGIDEAVARQGGEYWPSPASCPFSHSTCRTTPTG
jgi:uncharacterized membrane protein YdjX (TVP38/TMEM64 family)